MTHTPLAIVLGLALAAAFEASAAANEPSAGVVRVYIGTYTDGDSQGIYLCEFDAATGAIELKGLAAKAKNPSFLALHPSRKFLYAVSEVDDYAASRGGAVSAFSIDPADGRLTLLNHQPSMGAGPCHLSLDRQGKHALVANYGGGSIAVLPIDDAGRLGAPSAFVQHEGSSVNSQRQEAPHAHWIDVDPQNRFALVADLGLDKVLVYKFDATAGRLAPNDLPSVAMAAGAGPRHVAFHPSGKWAYVINELDSTVTALAYDAARGALEIIETKSTLPADARADNTTAEIEIHPSGKFLYGSNRGHDSIAMFAIDGESGRLTPLGHHPTGGRTPRSFGIDPTGGYLLAANQDSNSMVVHRIDSATGRLSQTGQQVDVPRPVCVKFAPTAEPAAPAP
jgi:6-phosphogluconolactonase